PTVKIPGVYTGHEDSLELSIYYPIPENYQPPGPAVWPSNGDSAPASSAAAAPASSSSASAKVPATTASSADPTTMATVVKPSTAASTATGSVGGSTSGTSKRYQQCGGKGYTGATECESGTTCKYSNDYYSQCL
ncbi:hypothetical protein KCU73_g10794, partial [Aureobasidium melanogenum]